jgi:hypothetical protein
MPLTHTQVLCSSADCPSVHLLLQLLVLPLLPHPLMRFSLLRSGCVLAQPCCHCAFSSPDSTGVSDVAAAAAAAAKGCNNNSSCLPYIS